MPLAPPAARSNPRPPSMGVAGGGPGCAKAGINRNKDDKHKSVLNKFIFDKAFSEI